ncbi:hypothetical protein FIU87_05525 [Bacillus sp. THAF10]|uniref:hypothetical protein n=1 Tax=Bacillus sp. THAF10 TaxID=2587848 RepID=UPI0012691728|nr:hypothetical protein [Bacillus sp. THAF10]QFT88092.1 hypothetical protein FIU87_05525 [Bacillus sp. THAF10]
MGKCSKKRIQKKRMKRQLKRRCFSKRIVKVDTITVVDSYKLTSNVTPPHLGYTDHLLYLGKHYKDNKLYQKSLDNVYGVSYITPVEKFINGKATILHHCSKCSSYFYGKPQNLLTIQTQHHRCSLPYGSIVGGNRLGKSGRTNERLKINLTNNSHDELFDYLLWNDFTPKEIAKKLEVTPKIIQDYFKQEGLI